MDKAIVMENGERIEFLEKDAKNYIYKTIAIYGGAQSGKTTIVDEILFLLKDKIPVVFAISPTNSSNNTFTDKIPSQCIKADLDVLWLERFIERQKNLTEVYKLTQNMKYIEPLFNKVATIQEKRCIETFNIRVNDFMNSIERNNEYSFAQKKARKYLLKKKHMETKINLCKTVIRNNQAKLLSMRLSKMERNLVKMIDINPNAILIFDDCASRFKRWFKKTDAFKTIFYNIRWISLTLIITSQDDKDIDTEYRKNVMLSIFTTHQVAGSNFSRPANGYTKEERAVAEMAIKSIFTQKKGEIFHYQKLCYARGEANPFKYTVADIYDNFKMCIRELWENIEDEDINPDNPYLS